jgi:hypothetical protein
MRKVTRALIIGASTATLVAGTFIAAAAAPAAASPVAAAPVAASPVAAAPVAASAVAAAPVEILYVSGDYRVAGVYIRTCPYTSCTALGLGYPGQGARIDCFRSGTSVNGNDLWLHHRNVTTGVLGYSADYYMRHGTLNIPRC